MRKIKIFAIVLVTILFSSNILYGCNMFSSVSAQDIYNKYIEIAKKYTVTQVVDNQEETIIDESLFNDNPSNPEYSPNLDINYKQGSEFQYEIDNRINDVGAELAIFHVFGEHYPQTLYTSMLFFNQYRHNLKNTSIKWEQDSLNTIYKNLLEVDKALNNFQKTKLALEAVTSFESGVEGQLYAVISMVKYNDFKNAYDNLLEKVIVFSKSFEHAFTREVLKPSNYEESYEIPYLEIRRSIFSASVYFAEAVYNYYINYGNGFLSSEVNSNLYDDMKLVKKEALEMQFSDDTVTDIVNSVFYHTLRNHEKQMISQSSLYIDAIVKANELKNSTNETDVALYNDYVAVILETTQTYSNYASFVLEMIDRVNTI